MFESAISIIPRTRACRFSAARPEAAERLVVGGDDVFDLDLAKGAAEVLGEPARVGTGSLGGVPRDIETQCTRSGPSAWAQSVAVTAESMPPETATTTSSKPFFVT